MTDQLVIDQLVFDFDEPCDGGRDLLGGKGLGLAEMTALGTSRPTRLHRSPRKRVAAISITTARSHRICTRRSGATSESSSGALASASAIR